MELFIPSLFVIVIAALFAFFVIPRTGSLILAITSLIALIVAGIHHYNLFYSEYALSTWQNGIATNAPIVILGLAFLFILGAIYYMFSGISFAAASTAPIETLETLSPVSANTIIESIENVANRSLNAMNRGLNAANKGLNIVTNTFNTVTNANKKNNSLIPGTNIRASQI